MRIGMMRVGHDAIIDESPLQKRRNTVKKTNNKVIPMSSAARVGDGQFHMFNPLLSQSKTPGV